MKKISTSALAKNHKKTTHELFDVLEAKGWIIRKDNKAEITDAGKNCGGDYVTSEKFGKYIVWPETLLEQDLMDEKVEDKQNDFEYLSATKIGDHFKISAVKINYILSELGWIEKSLKGWKVTTLGKDMKALQKENAKTGIPFVLWHKSILENTSLKETMDEQVGHKTTSVTSKEDVEFREKFKATFRATDGHMVRSKAEMIIDNWLYMAGIVHAYERKLPIEEDVYSDFYLPEGKIYIEFWGFENDSKYLHRKKIKQDIYSKYNFNLIELEDKEVMNLDDILPRMLLKFGVQSL